MDGKRDEGTDRRINQNVKRKLKKKNMKLTENKSWQFRKKY